jgi:hypothetical protein
MMLFVYIMALKESNSYEGCSIRYIEASATLVFTTSNTHVQHNNE